MPNGQDIELVWLLAEAVEVLGKLKLLDYVRHMAIKTIGATISGGLVGISLNCEQERTTTGPLGADCY